MEFRILGPLEVVEQGRTLALGGPRQRGLLALLLTRANEVVPVDRLIDELWEASPPATATNALQYHVSQLRKALGPGERVVTHEPGYVLRLGADELDLFRFERLVGDARTATPADASRLLAEALGLWRGPPLADLTGASFLQPEIARLEELSLSALEGRLEADLALGRQATVVAELEALVYEHPLRERLRALLMHALYASGRQADALAVYRDGRALLVDELGIEPGPALQALERAILRQDPGLLPAAASPRRVAAERERLILVVAGRDDALEGLLAIAEPLARHSSRALILARLLADGAELGATSAVLADLRGALAGRGVAARVAAYTTAEPDSDAASLATVHDVELLLLDAPPTLLDSGRFDDGLGGLLARAPCDVAILAGDGGGAAAGPVVTPFGGVDHDWSAMELAAWLAQSLGTTLRLVGTEADATTGRRDASRLLARASMLVQQVIGIVAEPVLVPVGGEGMRAAARDARLLVVGLSERWRTEGIGDVRRALFLGSAVPTLFVRRGLRPSGVAPAETFTRFTWTLGSPTAR